MEQIEIGLPEVKWKCLAHGYVRSSKLGDSCPDCDEENRKYDDYCRNNVVEGNVYEHYKGGEYKVLIIALCYKTMSKHVIYEIGDKIFDMPLSEFVEIFEDGTPRFKYLRNES